MNQKKNMTLIVLLAGTLFLQACGNKASNLSSNAKSNQTSIQTVAASSAPASPSPTPTNTPEVIKLDSETLTNTSGKTMLKSITLAKTGAFHTSLAIVSKNGTVIIADANSMPHEKGLIKADIVTVSHYHPDHIDANFLTPYRTKKIEAKVSIMTEESFTFKDVKVSGIAASHTSKFSTDQPATNYMYVYEVDGLRIAHLGDLGQDELSADQLKKLGKLDIVFTAMDGLGSFGRSTEKCINALEQLKPTIILPLHYDPDVIDKVLAALKIKDRSETDTLVIDKKEIDSIKGSKYIMLK